MTFKQYKLDSILEKFEETIKEINDKISISVENIAKKLENLAERHPRIFDYIFSLGPAIFGNILSDIQRKNLEYTLYHNEITVYLLIEGIILYCSMVQYLKLLRKNIFSIKEQIKDIDVSEKEKIKLEKDLRKKFIIYLGLSFLYSSFLSFYLTRSIKY